MDGQIHVTSAEAAPKMATRANGTVFARLWRKELEMSEPRFQFHLSTAISLALASGFLWLGLFGRPIHFMRKIPPGMLNSGEVLAFVDEMGLPFRSYRCVQTSAFSDDSEKDADTKGMTEISFSQYLQEYDKNFDNSAGAHFDERWLLSGLALNASLGLSIIGLWTLFCRRLSSRQNQHVRTAMRAAT